MTLLLASIASADEARMAVEFGADIVDIMDPAGGTLGALPPAVVRDIAELFGPVAATSAATGDLPTNPDMVLDAAQAMAATGVDHLKIASFPGSRRLDCIAALAPLARRTSIIGVMFADLGYDRSLIEVMRAAGFTGVMLDIAYQGGSRLLDHLGLPALRTFVGECRDRGLLAGLSGALEPPDVPRLLLLEPDILGFRGALCIGQNRISPVDVSLGRLLRDLIPGDPRSKAVGSRLTGAEGPVAPEHRTDAGMGRDRRPGPHAWAEAEHDRIFVHDFVLPILVGTYARERDAPQRVRFDVEASVIRSARAAQDMRDVVSYDLITDGIRLLAAGEHVPLLETLAERIAAHVLAHPRIARVTVRVEKLDLGPGTLGIEIIRERPAETAAVRQLQWARKLKADPKIAP